MEIFSSSSWLGPSQEPVERRVLIFLGVVALHLGILILLVISRQTSQPKQKQGALSVFSVAASPSPPAVLMPEPIVPAKAIAIISSPAEAHAEQQSAKGDPDGEVCSPLDVVTAQLASDPVVPVAINRVARSDRSISEAIVMWNAEWSTAAAADEAPLAQVRSRILLTLADLSPDCLATPVIGPRLIAISENGYTTFLAFGSGEWSWQQLLNTDRAAVPQNEEWTWEDLINGDAPTIF